MKIFKSKKLECSFIDNTLIVEIQGDREKQLFEIGTLSTSLNDLTYIKNFYDKFNSIYNLIDYLGNNY